MKATVEKIWMEDHGVGNKAIRIDWSNDRHQRVEINKPHNSLNVMAALKEMYALLYDEDQDKHI